MVIAFFSVKYQEKKVELKRDYFNYNQFNNPDAWFVKL